MQDVIFSFERPKSYLIVSMGIFKIFECCI